MFRAKDYKIKVWDLDTGKIIAKYPIYGSHEKAFFSFDGKYIASAERDGVDLWQLKDGKYLREYKKDRKVVRYIF